MNTLLKRALFCALLIIALTNPAAILAQQTKVVADTPVVHSLVSMVLGNNQEPALLIPASVTPHDYALRPSDAIKLQSAELVVWTSAQLTPWLEKTIRSVAPDAISVELMSLPNTLVLPFRYSEDFKHTHVSQAMQNAPPGSDDNIDYDKRSIDPHGWLDPVNVNVWLSVIADKLSELDPDNTEHYQHNASHARNEIDALNRRITDLLRDYKDQRFVVFHDSYQYFESRYGLSAMAAISASDAHAPGIRHIRELRRELSGFSNLCVFSEPQFSTRIMETVTQGLQVNLGMLDPIGATLPLGSDQYPALLMAMTNEFLRCFDQPR